MEEKLLDVLLAPEVIALAAAIVTLLYGLGKIPVGGKENLGHKWWWRRILPVLPLVLGVLGAFINNAVGGEDGTPFHHPLLVGLWAGFVAAHGRKVFKRLLVDKPDKE